MKRARTRKRTKSKVEMVMICTQIARQNAEVLRRDVAGFLSRTTLSPRENRSGAGRPAREEAEREAVRSEKRSWSEDAPLTPAGSL